MVVELRGFEPLTSCMPWKLGLGDRWGPMRIDREAAGQRPATTYRSPTISCHTQRVPGKLLGNEGRSLAPLIEESSATRWPKFPGYVTEGWSEQGKPCITQSPTSNARSVGPCRRQIWLSTGWSVLYFALETATDQQPCSRLMASQGLARKSGPRSRAGSPPGRGRARCGA
jgi:hypothetical protein